jgi:fatty-acyl-CoA synthase
VAGAVPTIWNGLLQQVRAHGGDLSSLRLVPCGGSAVPHALIEAYEKELGVTIVQAWGMTETSPLGSFALAPAGLPDDEAWRYRDTQGRLMCQVEHRLAGDSGVLPEDGSAVGEVEVRGPWVTGSYYADDDEAKFHDGWLRTGDVGTIDPLGFVTLTDRAKDVIKSGGEWISSMELENALMGHPEVAEAAVIGVADDRWGERPLAAVVLAEGATVTAPELRAFLADRVPRWQLPERWSFIDEVPKTSVGKFAKTRMREAYARGDYQVIDTS